MPVWALVLIIIFGSIFGIFLLLGFVAFIKKPSSIYKNKPQEKNPMEGKMVEFVYDENDKENADDLPLPAGLRRDDSVHVLLLYVVHLGHERRQRRQDPPDGGAAELRNAGSGRDPHLHAGRLGGRPDDQPPAHAEGDRRADVARLRHEGADVVRDELHGAGHGARERQRGHAVVHGADGAAVLQGALDRHGRHALQRRDGGDGWLDHGRAQVDGRQDSVPRRHSVHRPDLPQPQRVVEQAQPAPVRHGASGRSRRAHDPEQHRHDHDAGGDRVCRACACACGGRDVA